MMVTCIDNSNWFGTIGGEYKVLSGGTKTIKDIAFTDDNFTYEFYSIIDDCGEYVEIPVNKFK